MTNLSEGSSLQNLTVIWTECSRRRTNNFWATGTFVSARVTYAYRTLPVFSLNLSDQRNQGCFKTRNHLGPLGPTLAY